MCVYLYLWVCMRVVFRRVCVRCVFIAVWVRCVFVVVRVVVVVVFVVVVLLPCVHWPRRAQLEPWSPWPRILQVSGAPAQSCPFRS